MPPKRKTQAAAAAAPNKKKVCITSADGQTGHLIAELLLTDDDFSSKIDSLCLVALDPSLCADLEQTESGVPVTIVHLEPGHKTKLVHALEKAKPDVIFLIPPSKKDKLKLTHEMVEATKKVGVKCVILLSSAGADLAERDKQPHLREFIDIEQMVLETKGMTDTEAGHSPCVIR